MDEREREQYDAWYAKARDQRLTITAWDVWQARAALAATQAEPIYQIESERIANIWVDVTYDRYASWTSSPKRIVYAAPESSEKEETGHADQG